MSYVFDKDAKDGDVVTLENGVAYQYDAAKDRWLVKAVAGGGTGADWGFPIPEEKLSTPPLSIAMGAMTTFKSSLMSLSKR